MYKVEFCLLYLKYKLHVPCFMLQVPKAHGDYDHRRFSVEAPHLWNCLPMDLKLVESLASFQRKLKTHLFEKAYGQ